MEITNDKWYALKDGVSIREFSNRKEASKYYEHLHKSGIKIIILNGEDLIKIRNKENEN